MTLIEASTLRHSKMQYEQHTNQTSDPPFKLVVVKVFDLKQNKLNSTLFGVSFKYAINNFSWKKYIFYEFVGLKEDVRLNIWSFKMYFTELKSSVRQSKDTNASFSSTQEALRQQWLKSVANVSVGHSPVFRHPAGGTILPSNFRGDTLRTFEDGSRLGWTLWGKFISSDNKWSFRAAGEFKYTRNLIAELWYNMLENVHRFTSGA